MRNVTDADFDSIYEIYTDESVSRFMSYGDLSKDDFKEVFESLKSRCYFFIFEDEAGAYGHCTVENRAGRCAASAYLGTFGIKSSRQGQGLGKKALQQVEDYLREQGFKTLYFFVESDNETAIPFYKKLGFKESGMVPQYFKRENEDHYVDDYIFSKVLN